MAGISIGEMGFQVDVRRVDTQHDMQHFRAAKDGVLNLFGVEPRLNVQQQVIAVGRRTGRRAFEPDRFGDLAHVSTSRKLDPDADPVGTRPGRDTKRFDDALSNLQTGRALKLRYRFGGSPLLLGEFGKQLSVGQREPAFDSDILSDLCPPDRGTAIDGEFSVFFPPATPARGRRFARLLRGEPVS